MFKSYLKSSLAAFWRMKWFSIFTLFSIAISLVVITCGASLWNMISAPIPPEVNKDRTFFLDFNSDSKVKGSINVTELNMIMEISGKFINNDVYEFKTPELTTVYLGNGIAEFIRNNKIKQVDMMSTDPYFFKVFEFDFVAGKPYSENDFSDDKSSVCVISEEMANYYFGGIDCIGRMVVYYNQQYKVCGIIKKPTTWTTIKSDLYCLEGPEAMARQLYNCDVAFLCNSENDKNELDSELKKWVHSSKYGQLTLSSNSPVMHYLTKKIRFNREQVPLYCMIVLIALFIPVICLIDILRNNQALRNEELAIRRTFGATRMTIASLLLVDNLVLTIVGGILGLLFSFMFFAALNDDSWRTLFFAFFNWRAFFYFASVFILIGVLAGLLPAHIISKQQIVNALNSKEND